MLHKADWECRGLFFPYLIFLQQSFPMWLMDWYDLQWRGQIQRFQDTGNNWLEKSNKYWVIIEKWDVCIGKHRCRMRGWECQVLQSQRWSYSYSLRLRVDLWLFGGFQLSRFTWWISWDMMVQYINYKIWIQ